jgi:hypothetical protein
MMPNVSDMIDFENGEMDPEDVAEFFQGMINSGVVWQLQGFKGRTAVALIEAGDCVTADEYVAIEAVRAEEAREEAWANGRFGVGA